MKSLPQAIGQETAMQEKKDYDVFVSYAVADEAFVQGYLIKEMEAANLKVYCREAFALGPPVLSEFEDAVDRSRRTVLVISPNYQIDLEQKFVSYLASTRLLRGGNWE